MMMTYLILLVSELGKAWKARVNCAWAGTAASNAPVTSVNAVIRWVEDNVFMQ